MARTQALFATLRTVAARLWLGLGVGAGFVLAVKASFAAGVVGAMALEAAAPAVCGHVGALGGASETRISLLVGFASLGALVWFALGVAVALVGALRPAADAVWRRGLMGLMALGPGALGLAMLSPICGDGLGNPLRWAGDAPILQGGLVLAAWAISGVILRRFFRG